MIGKVIEQYRLRHGETQVELGEAIGKSKSTVQTYENGISKVPFEVREAVARRYGVPDDKLGLDLPQAGTMTPGQQDSARALALYVLKTSDDETAKRLATDFLAESLAIKI